MSKMCTNVSRMVLVNKDGDTGRYVVFYVNKREAMRELKVYAVKERRAVFGGHKYQVKHN